MKIDRLFYKENFHISLHYEEKELCPFNCKGILKRTSQNNSIDENKFITTNMVNRFIRISN